MQSKPDPDVYERFQFSYGAWTFLASMLLPKEFLMLQALNSYAYKTGISRV